MSGQPTVQSGVRTAWLVDVIGRLGQFTEKLAVPGLAGFGDRSTADVEREAHELMRELWTAQRFATAAWKSGKETETVVSRAAVVVLASMIDRMCGNLSAAAERN